MATRAANVSIWKWDLANNAFYLDPSAKAMLGYQDEEVSNTLGGWKSLVYPADLEAMLPFVHPHRGESNKHYVYEHRMLHRDGSIHWVRMDGTIICDEQGRASCMIGTLRDITARKQAQLTLEATNASLNRHIAELSSLNSMAQMITTAADQRSALESVAEALCRLFDTTGVEISLFSQEGAELTPLVHYSYMTVDTTAGVPASGERFDEATDPIPVRSTSVETSFFHSLRQGNSLILYNANQIAEVSQSIRIVRELHLQGIMAVPLAVRGKVLGIAVTGSEQPDRIYTGSELELLETIAGQIAGVVESLSALDKERALRQIAEYHERELTNLLQIAEQLASTLDLNSLLESLLTQIEAVVPCTVSTIMSLEEDELIVLAYHGPMPKVMALQQRLPRVNGEFLLGNDGEPFIVAADVAQKPALHGNLKKLFGKQLPQFMGRCRSWASVPLYGSKGSKSVIILGHRTPDRFAGTDWQFVSAVAARAATTIENAQLYRSL